MSVAANTAEFIRAVAPALGIATERVQRLVIDADVLGGPVRVYVKIIGADGEPVAAAIPPGTVEARDWPPPVELASGPTPTEMRILAQLREIMAALERINDARAVDI